MIWNRIKDTRLFLLSVILFSLALCYPQELGFLVFIFLTPILFYLDKNKKLTSVGLFGRMFLFSFVSISISTSWFLSAFPLDWLKITDPFLSILIIVPLWLSFVVAMSLTIAFWPLLIRKLQTGLMFVDAFLGASLWVMIEYLRSWVLAIGIYSKETLFGPHHTYYSVAYPVSNIPMVRELFPFGGMYLVSFFVIFSNYFFYYCVMSYLKNKRISNSFYLVALFLVGTICFSMLVLQCIRSKGVVGNSFTATVVNMQEPSGSTVQIVNERTRLALSYLSSMNNPDGIIIFPENINVLPLNVDGMLDKKVPGDRNLIIGSFTGHQFYNMYFFTSFDKKVEYYSKQLLMPIGEYNIFWVNFLIQKSNPEHWKNVYDIVKRTTKKGLNQNVFPYQRVKGLVFGGSLCSENISPYIYRNETRMGATVLLNIASHAPFHGSSLLARQTLAINTVRALENGRYFITSSNYSPSFVVTDEGNLVYTSASQRKGSSGNVVITTKEYITPYVKYGDYFVLLTGLTLSLRIIWFREKLYFRKG